MPAESGVADMRGRAAAGRKRSRPVRPRPSGRPAIGILGGMGPEATGYFFDLILRNTPAAKDQDHLPVLIWSDPGVPPRTDAILGTGPSPLPALLAGVSRLERAGAGLIAMPCITAHFWAREVAAAARVPFIDLVRETAGHARKAFPRLRTAGLLASTGTVRSGLFQAAFKRKGISLLAPEPREQEAVMEAIFGPRGIKAGFTAGPPRSAVLRIARRLIDRGAQAVVAGCTEIPLVLRPSDIPVPLLEPMLIGARACIRRAGGRLRPSPQVSGPARRG